MNGNAPLLVRIAEIEVYPEWLDAYLDSARTVGAMSPLDPEHMDTIFKKMNPDRIKEK